MDMMQLGIICAALIGIAGFGALAFVFLGNTGATRQGDIRGLMTTSRGAPASARLARAEIDPYELDADEIKRRTLKSSQRKKDESIDSKLFRAGYYTSRDKEKFNRVRIIAFAVALVFMPTGMFLLVGDARLVFLALILGAFIGYSWPITKLEKQIRKREEEILYYLPLVIEQISIGVSSSLDVGPCISNIVSMADERDSHNVVTEMLVHVEKLMKSGLNLEDSLQEVGEANRMTEVKHAFMFLGQCAKHGGEISKQLQELADAVSVQRQVAIEGKITALPVKATGPLAMVFAGFFALLFAGLLVRLLSAFGK